MKNSLKYMLFFHFITFITIFFDIPILRQIVVLINISFIPGYLILNLLEINLKRVLDKILLSVGLSISFLMFIGLIINELYPLFGITNPLSILPLYGTIAVTQIILLFINFKLDYSANNFSILTVNEILQIIPLITLPILAVFGALLKNNLIIGMMIIAVEILIIIPIFFRKKMSTKLFPIILLIIAFSLLIQHEALSKYLIGWDVFGEFHVFKLTNDNSLWTATISLLDKELQMYHSMLSVTILPTIYSKMLNIQGELIFKVLYPFLASLIPVIMYQAYHRKFGKSTAFLAASYFIIFPTSHESRQIVGELFLVLLISIILSIDIDSRNKKILSSIFTVSLVISHYSLSYLFVFYILIALIVSYLIRKIRSIKLNLKNKSLITVNYVLLTLVFGVIWYYFITPYLSVKLIEVIDNLKTSFIANFFSLDSRGDAISGLIAPQFSSMSLLFILDYLVNKLPFVFIGVGLFILIKKHEVAIKLEYIVMIVANFLILLIVLLVPFFGTTLHPHRFYHISLLFLAPICVMGGKTVLSWIFNFLISIKRANLISIRLIAIFFVIIFLFKTGFIYEIAEQAPAFRVISFNRMKLINDPEIKTEFYEAYVPEQDVYSALWLSKMQKYNSTVYADLTSKKHVLRSYGMIIVDWEHVLNENITLKDDSYIYLRYLNTQGLIREDTEGLYFSNMTGIFHQLVYSNKIYSNDYSEIYQSIPYSN